METPRHTQNTGVPCTSFRYSFQPVLNTLCHFANCTLRLTSRARAGCASLLCFAAVLCGVVILFCGSDSVGGYGVCMLKLLVILVSLVVSLLGLAAFVWALVLLGGVALSPVVDDSLVSSLGGLVLVLSSVGASLGLGVVLGRLGSLLAVFVARGDDVG